MYDTFNTASLANLTKSDLQARLATLTARFHSAATDADRAHLGMLIHEVKQALALK